MGPVRARSSDTERLVPREDSRELERLSTTISLVKGKMGGNALHIGRAEVYERAVHPCCGNCRYDRTGNLGQLCCHRKM